MTDLRLGRDTFGCPKSSTPSFQSRLKARPENLKLDGMIASDRAALLRHIPSLDELLRQSHCVALVERNGHAAVADATRAVLTRLREEITAGDLNEKELQLALQGIRSEERRV